LRTNFYSACEACAIFIHTKFPPLKTLLNEA
jgi:hypothetical protein